MEHHEMAEKLVEKCGISYEEAGLVLKEANYDMLEAMIILERRGRLGGGTKNQYSTLFTSNDFRKHEKTAADCENFNEFMRIAWKNICTVCSDILRYNVIVSHNGKEVLSFPLILAIVLVCFTAGLAMVLLVLSLLGGCSYSIRKE